MALTIQGCCAEEIESLGQDCLLETASPRNLLFIPRFFNGGRNGIDLLPTAPDTVGSQVQEMADHTSTTYSKMWVLPEPTQVQIVKSEDTTTDDPVGYRHRTEGGGIQTVTVSYMGDYATRILEDRIIKLFKCNELDMLFTDDNGAIAGVVKKSESWEFLYGYQVVNSSYTTNFAPAVKGSSPNTLTVVFQVRRVNNSQYLGKQITATELGYDANDLEALKHYSGVLEAVSSTSLSLILRGESAKATSGLYITGAKTLGTWSLVNKTTNTTTTIASSAITEVVVADEDIIVGTNEPRYTITITAQTAGNDLEFRVSGLPGYETVVSNTVDAL